MIEEWEEFEGGPKLPVEERLHVTLNFKGVIFFNRVAYEALGKPESAVLLFEKRNSKIGIRPANAVSRKTFPLMQQRRLHSRIIRAASYCQNYGIRVQGTVAFHDIDIDSDGMMKLDLGKTWRVRRIVAKGQ